MDARRFSLPISTAIGGSSPPARRGICRRLHWPMLHFDTEPRRGYLYVTVTGQLDVAGAETGLAEMFDVAARAHQSRILLDCSRVGGQWGPDERYTVGSFIAAEMERRANHFPERPRL